MKTRFTLDCVGGPDFSVLAINSHIKAYKLCWMMNKSMQLNFEKNKDHNIKEELWLTKYTYICDGEARYTLLENRSKNGYLMPSQKSVNFFLLIKNDYWQQEKTVFISKLKELKDVLLVFEFDTKLIKQIDRFIFNDTKD